MQETMRESGIPAVGGLLWGSHFCQFYQTQDDLVGALIPYFKAGLEGDEQCLWVTSAPLRVEEARSALCSALPSAPFFLARGQIEILDYRDWYQRSVALNHEELRRVWLGREEQALTRGRQGLRVSENTPWRAHHKDLRSFAAYEESLSHTLQSRRIIGLCSYSLSRFEAERMVEVVRSHQCSLLRRAGGWEIIESAPKKLAKEEPSPLNEELERRVAARTAELEDALKERDEFLSVASHELKTPLASLQLYMDSLLLARERALPPEELIRRLQNAQAQCHRLNILINRLLDVSRTRAGSLPMHLEPLDLAELTRFVLERFSGEMSRFGCQVTLHAPHPVLGSWDRVRLDQVLTNLLSNALQYAPGCPIEVTVAEDGPAAILEVRDHGEGIPLSAQEKIFERFIRFSPQNYGGFGLGLWIVREIVTAQGGEVNVRSQPGAGASFWVRLPRATSPR